MGGFGSGRSGAPGPTVETSVRLELPRLRREGYLKLGHTTRGSLCWTRGGTAVAKVAFSCRMDAHGLSELVVSYSVAGQPLVQRIAMEAVPMRFGGVRFYFVCPRTQRRCTTLVLPIGRDRFASVKGWGLAYQSQREDAFRRAHRRIAKTEARLGSLSKYARRPTRQMLWQRIERAEAVLDYGATVMLAALMGKPVVSRSVAGRLRASDVLDDDE